jgi:hypothetical protein
MLEKLDDIDGRPAGLDDAGNQLYYQLLPRELIELNMEIALKHPKLQQLLNEGLRSDAYDMSTLFGIIFSYCGIAQDGVYEVGEMAEQATRALVNKRENMAVSVNTIPTAQGLVQHIIDMKEGNKGLEIVTRSKLN